MSDPQEQLFRREHPIARVCAALLLTKHQKNHLSLESDYLKSRKEKITQAVASDDVERKYVVSAFSHVLHTALSIAAYDPNEEGCYNEHETRIPTEKCATLIRSEIAVFKEFCIELLLEFEKDDKDEFSVDRTQFRLLVSQAADWLAALDREEIMLCIFQIYAAAMFRHMSEDSAEVVELNGQAHGAREARLRLAAGTATR